MLPCLLWGQNSIVPENGYYWPDVERSYWPTAGWRNDPIENHHLALDKIDSAHNLAQSDSALRSLLIIKDGFLVFEKYYHAGGINQSTEVWSVTKSFTSALVGIAIDQGYIDGVERLMLHYLPEYPSFEKISIQHVLTHSTGLNWDESDQQAWIQSDDWIANALDRVYYDTPGNQLLYSSANSHFLSGLIQKTTGITPGEFANQHLFKPLGIEFKPADRIGNYLDWQELHIPVPHSWRQDNHGLEIGAFGLHVTAREMAKFGFLYLNKGRWQDKAIISESWVLASTRDYIRRSENFGFGFHWVVTKRHDQLCFEADGWGGHMISIIPALDMVVVIKCDEINPGESYHILNLVIEAAVN